MRLGIYYLEIVPLRPYQNKAIESIRTNYLAGINRQLLCMATGTGKTEVFAHLPQETKDILPGQSMILLHRDELAQQAYKKLIQLNPKFRVNIEAGGLYADPDADVVIASVQTLGRKDTKRVNRFDFSHFDKWIVDEAHRSITESYYNVYNAANLLLPGDKRLLLGVTATPVRGDGQGLGQLYEKISYSYGLRTAIEEGYLVDIRGIRVDTETSLDGVRTKGGDYDQKELADAVNNPARNELVCQAYMDNCAGRQAIGFSVDIQHAKDLAKTFQDHGLWAEAVWGNDPDRAQKITEFRERHIDILFNAQLLTEGFDLPSITCVILAAPTKSPVVFSQRVGRGTRLYDGKSDCIVLDVCDSTSRHSLVTLPTLLGMPSRLNMRGHGLVESIKIIEEELKELPHLDFTTLKDIDQIKAFVEDVNLFEVKFPSEVEQNSEFTWHPAYTGGYILMLPNKDSVTIKQNLLDKFELYGIIKGKKYRGERDTIEDAFSAADTLIRKEVPECLKVVKREAEWHNLPPTEKQLKQVKKLFKGKQIPDNLTRGSASKLIGSALAGKEKKNGKR